MESLSNGVVEGKNNWDTSKTACYGVTTYGTSADQDNRASYWAHDQLYKPYNYNFLDKKTRKKFYCSQLVWAAYKDLYNIDLDTIAFPGAVHPMELVNTSKTFTVYKK